MTKKILSGILVMALVLMIPGQSGSQALEKIADQELSLEQAYEITFKSSSAVEVARLDVKKAQAKVDWANDTANALDSDLVDTYEKGKSKIFVPAQAKSELFQAQEKLKQTEAQFTKEVDQAYFGVIKARKQVDSAKVAYKRADEQLQVLNSKFKAGRVAKLEVLEAEIQADSAQAILLDAENNEKTALMKLNQMLGHELNTPLVLKNQLAYSPPPQINVEEETENAMGKRVDIIQSREAVELKRIENEIASSFYGPGVYVYEDSRYSLLQAESQLKEKLRTSQVAIETAYFNMLSLDRQYHLAEKSLRQAQEALELAQLRYTVGLIKVTDVTSASAALFQAESKLTDVLYQYHIAKIQLVLELGQY